MESERCGPILVVDDDADIRESLQLALEEEGYKVVTAVNGRDALAKLVDIGRPCVILLDLMMPEMNGIELLRALRSDPDRAGVPVVVLSALESIAASVEGKQAYLCKPVSLTGVLGMVEAYCG